MTFAALCASHSPLALIQPDADPGFGSAMSSVAVIVREFQPDLVIQFAPDHFNGLFYDLMPNFCLGGQATSVGDWGTPTGRLNVPAELSRAALNHVRGADIDLDFSLDLKVDHGLTQVWSMMFSDLPAIPLLPIVINCAAPPRPAIRRARQLGAALGRFAASLDQRVLFVASGGMSHDPPIPSLETAQGPQLEFLISGRNPSREDRLAREERVIAAAGAFQQGSSFATPPDANWDRVVLDLMASGSLEAFDDWRDEDITAKGGCGAHELRTWIAALSALQAAGGTYDMKLVHYAITDAWMTGMGVITASTSGASASRTR